ncbi:uncharacterized protein LOC116260279 [Nymphaea colorata]|uniref:uncharacterized protein LOC116260279 n=1 Tax=Nymphaea colorata TaxID=210225 RepID=UPI00129DD8B8|nr:uncharacterized protein LOC116260279 [Nymphaea colorata]
MEARCMELDGQKEERASGRNVDDVKERFSRAEHLQPASKTSRYIDREEKIDDLEPSRSTYRTKDKSSPSSKQLENPASKGILGPPSSSASMAEATNDINAAKVAAMKTAELVNKNLVGVGYLSTEQKKNLLWGNKKNAAVEESGNCWDMALFSHKEHQEKFNKFMGVKGSREAIHCMCEVERWQNCRPQAIGADVFNFCRHWAI